ncbi:MAG: hypothetical protein JO296_05405 [Pseudonocardiales bacterium]|nr:hypothetical protein [Pseudonocardiales bacterium]
MIRAARPPQLLHTSPLRRAFDRVNLGLGRVSSASQRYEGARRTVTRAPGGELWIRHPQAG